MCSLMHALRSVQLSIAQYVCDVAAWIINGNYSIYKEMETVLVPLCHALVPIQFDFTKAFAYVLFYWEK